MIPRRFVFLRDAGSSSHRLRAVCDVREGVASVHRREHEEGVAGDVAFARLGYAPRDWVALAAISVVVGVCGVLGVSYVAGQGWRSFDALTTVLLCVAASALAAVIIIACERGFARISLDARPHPRLSRLTPSWSWRSVAVFSVIMALFWLPWLIANYPGGTYWDTYYQIFQCYPENHPIAVIPYAECYDNTLTDAYLCDHHPIVDTLIYGAFGMASDALTGNWMAGVFAFVCLQGALTIVAFTASVAYLRERSCPVPLCFFAYAFLCVMPFISTWALCMVKDSLFGLFYVPYMMMLFEAVRTRGESLRDSRTVALFALVGLALCLTKKTGIYVVVPTALIAALISFARLRAARSDRSRVQSPACAPAAKAHVPRADVPCASRGADGPVAEAHSPRILHRHRERVARPRGHEPWKGYVTQALLCVVVMMVIFPLLVFPLLNVAPGGKQEVLGTLFQQTARYVLYYPEDVTEEEREAIDALLEYDNLARQYTFNFQDEVKYRYNLDATADEIAAYLEVWAAQGLRHPESYLASLFSIAGYYVAPCGAANIRMVTVDTHMGDDDRYMLWNPDELDWLRLGLDEAYKTVSEIPGVNGPLLLAVYVFWLPAVLMFVAWRNRLRCGTLFAPALILLGFCVIAPVYDARYCIPLLNAAPLMLCMVAVLLRESAARGRDGKSDIP